VCLAIRTQISVSRHFLLQALQCTCYVRKRFGRDHCCRGRSKPGCRIDCWLLTLTADDTRWHHTTLHLRYPPLTRRHRCAHETSTNERRMIWVHKPEDFTQLQARLYRVALWHCAKGLSPHTSKGPHHWRQICITSHKRLSICPSASSMFSIQSFRFITEDV